MVHQSSLCYKDLTVQKFEDVELEALLHEDDSQAQTQHAKQLSVSQ